MLSVGALCSLEISCGCIPYTGWQVLWMACGGIKLVILEWEAPGCVFGISGFSVLAVWSRNTILAQSRKAHFFLI